MMLGARRMVLPDAIHHEQEETTQGMPVADKKYTVGHYNHDYGDGMSPYEVDHNNRCALLSRYR